MFELSLLAVAAILLVLPITVRIVEENLEIFLFVMGSLSAALLHFWGNDSVSLLLLLKEALTEPLMITAAVVLFGLLVYFFRPMITGFIIGVEHKLGSKLFCFALITILGMAASVITAIMAAIILVETVSALKFDRKFEVRLVVLGCFAIGLGAVLTPIGEPLSAIAAAKLRGEPYHADFFFLLRTLGKYIIPGIAATGFLCALIEPSVKEEDVKGGLIERGQDTLLSIFTRGGKVYVFIVGLIFLGAGFRPIVEKYMLNLSSSSLYWMNSASAIMDNATLTAAEVSPKMLLGQIQYALMGLLLAGVMLIPGNIPNIICAGKLGITSKEWAKIGLPLGLAAMGLYFLILKFC